MPGHLNIFDLLVGGAAFGLVLALWLVLVIAWASHQGARRRRIAERLGTAPDKPSDRRALRLWVDGRLTQTLVPNQRRHLSLYERLDRLQEHAGLTTSPGALLLGLAGACTAGFLAAYAFSHNPLLGLGGAVAVVLAARIWLGRRVAVRLALFEQQLVDALGLAGRSLRAGHPLTGAFMLVAEEMRPPVSRIFADICQQQAMGLGLDEAIRQAALRTNSTDFKLFATAVIIQLRSGGNLADMMDRLTQVIRERLRLSRRIRVLTAQTHFSKNSLIVLPFIVFLLLTVINPDYIAKLYTTSTGQMLIGVGLAGIVLGAWVMNRMSVLRY